VKPLIIRGFCFGRCAFWQFSGNQGDLGACQLS